MLSKTAGYKINVQKSVGLLVINNVLYEKWIRKTMPFTTASKTKQNKT